MGGTEVTSLVHGGGETRHENFHCQGPGEYFHLPYNAQVIVYFHDMHRLLWQKDLDVAQVTIFAL